MDTELVRFRVDPDLRDKAAQVCAELGLELPDVLRAFVTRIASDGALPFDLSNRATRLETAQQPFQDYEAGLWSPIKPQVDAEVALTLLARFIARCTAQLEDAEEATDTTRLKPELTDRLIKDRDDARKMRDALDVSDAVAVAKVISTYGPLMRGRKG
jgi:DNA-damage-inducible protein J